MTKILTIDEDGDIVCLLHIRLSRAGYCVRHAYDAAEAIALTRDFAPDLITTELQLPDADGVDLVAQLAEHPTAPAVLVLTNQTEDAVIAAALAAGAVDYMSKPFNCRNLLERIRVNLLRSQQTAPRLSAVSAPPNLSGPEASWLA